MAGNLGYFGLDKLPEVLGLDCCPYCGAADTFTETHDTLDGHLVTESETFCGLCYRSLVYFAYGAEQLTDGQKLSAKRIRALGLTPNLFSRLPLTQTTNEH